MNEWSGIKFHWWLQFILMGPNTIYQNYNETIRKGLIEIKGILILKLSKPIYMLYYKKS